MGLYQLTTSLPSQPKCHADLASLPIEGACPASCENPDPKVQPVYYAADYGYVGGFAQGASEEAMMQELYKHGPLCLELSVKAIPLIIAGNGGEIITHYDNSI